MTLKEHILLDVMGLDIIRHSGTNSGRRPAYQLYFWRLSHDCHVITFLCSTLTSWHSLSAKASIVTLPWTYLTDCFSCNSNSHLFHYFSWASLSRAVSTVAAFLHFTMLCTVPNQSLHLTVIQVISLSLIFSYAICQLHDPS